MINKIYRTEDEYIECFCQVDHLDRYVRYTDNHIKDMYSHNFIRIDHDVTSDIFREVVEKEIVYRKKQGKKYLRVVTSAEIDNKFIRKQHELNILSKRTQSKTREKSVITIITRLW